MNYVNGPEMPMGFGMALAQNQEAMAAFIALPESERKKVLEGTHTIQSKEEMRRYAASLVDRMSSPANNA